MDGPSGTPERDAKNTCASILTVGRDESSMALGSDTAEVDLRRHVSLVFAGAVALGVGSAMLLLGAVVWLGGGGQVAFVLRSPALVIHFIGWMLLLASIKALSLSPRGEDKRLVVPMMSAWVLSVLAAIVGIWTLPWVLSWGICGSVVCSLSLLLFLPAAYFPLPFVPSVFAPVIVCHAAFFLLEARRHELIAWGRLRNGAVILVALAAASIAVQAVGWFSGAAYLLAGLTAVGYTFIVSGLLRTLRIAREFNGSVPAVSRLEGL